MTKYFLIDDFISVEDLEKFNILYVEDDFYIDYVIPAEDEVFKYFLTKYFKDNYSLNNQTKFVFSKLVSI